MDKGDKVMLLAAVMVFLGTFAVGIIYYWPYPKEPVTVGLDEQWWPVGSYDFEIAGAFGKIPLLNFRHEGINYTTYDDGNGWVIKPIKISPERMKENVNNETTLQKFLLRGGSVSDNPDTLFVMRVVVIDDNVRYSIEEVYSASNYELSFKQEGNQAIVSHRLLIFSFLTEWAGISFVLAIVGGVVGGIIAIIAKVMFIAMKKVR